MELNKVKNTIEELNNVFKTLIELDYSAELVISMIDDTDKYHCLGTIFCVDDKKLIGEINLFKVIISKTISEKEIDDDINKLILKNILDINMFKRENLKINTHE